MKKTTAIVAVAVASVCGARTQRSDPSRMVSDVLEPLPPGAVKLSGGLAEPIARSLAHWHKGNVPYSAFTEFFRTGRPQFALGEMWGKFVRSGAMQYHGLVAVKRIEPSYSGHRLEFRVPTESGDITMCDYASVDGWKGKRIQTWLPLSD